MKRPRVFWLLSFIFLAIGIISLIFINIQTSKIGGDAISGMKIENNYFFSKSSGDGFIKVSKITWYSNYIGWISSIVATFIGFIFFGISIVVNWLPLLLNKRTKNSLH